MSPLSTALLATPPLVDPVPSKDEVGPGWGLAALVIGLIVVTYLLWRSLGKQLGKIRFDEEPDEKGTPTDDPTSRGQPERRENGAGPA